MKRTIDLPEDIAKRFDDFLKENPDKDFSSFLRSLPPSTVTREAEEEDSSDPLISKDLSELIQRIPDKYGTLS